MTVSATERRAWAPEETATPEAVARRLAAQGVILEVEEIGILAGLLGGPPRWAEAVLFGILWSEHCSYKSTRHLLKRLPTSAPQVILGPGEDAGVVALPAPCDDLALVLGHESHNHPSQVLPVEGAATGVGGIVRDIGCMGAEVIGVLDALRFGDPVADGVGARDIVRGVVRGIADYGNALGVPNLGGDVVFDSGFATNCLVNVMSAGIAPRAGILRSRVPGGPGPWVFVLVGKPTDESGFGGAAFASGELGDGDQRGAVQLPDPFLKRVLHVANAEMFRRIRERGIPAGFKDLGAGGIACATSELAAAGGRGADIVLDDAHVVSRPLPPEVLLCAETQERFCWVLPEAFAEEACGDQFLLRDGVVHRLAAETGDIGSLELPLMPFLERVRDDGVATLNLEPLLAFLETGHHLEPGQLLSVFPPFILMASEGGVTLKAVPAVERLLFLADLARQLHDLPDGAEITFRTVP